MTFRETEHFRRLLTKRLEALEIEDATASEARDTVPLDQQSVGRLSRMDALQQQAMAKATHLRRTQERTQIAAALARIEDSSYGKCTECGEPIAPRRLELNPIVTLCISCASD